MNNLEEATTGSWERLLSVLLRLANPPFYIDMDEAELRADRCALSERYPAESFDT